MTLSSLLQSRWFQPASYYVTIETITASGSRVTSSSNGVTIDATPPEVTTPIQNFDLSFSEREPVRFQGSNDTISARWGFQDEQSDVIEYMWAVGTSPYGGDIQEYISVGIAGEAVLRGLTLIHNTTYYVSVLARNGAGLVANVTSTEGVTYIATELNVTLLGRLVNVEFTELLEFTDAVTGEGYMVRRTDRDSHAGVQWEGVGTDIEDLCKP